MKNVYQLSDLSHRNLLDEGADKPALLAVIGAPVAHSASPQMHQEALDALDIDARYIRLEVNPGEVSLALKKMQELGFLGFNVTVPHKLEVMKACDDLTDDARAMGAVNTVILGDEVIGHNTDASGFTEAIQEDFHADIADLNIMIVGTGGGAGRAVATQCARLDCPNLYLVNRTVSKAQNLAKQLLELKSTSNISAFAPDEPNIQNYIDQTNLIINATSLGLKTNDPLPLIDVSFSKDQLVYDMIYNPAETAFLQKANNEGAQTANGLSMLLHQGVLAYQQWFPKSQPLEHMRKGLTSTLSL